MTFLDDFAFGDVVVGRHLAELMSNYQANDVEYMADEYDMEDIEDEMDNEFQGRDMAGSDSDVDEYDNPVCGWTLSCFWCY